MTRTHHQYWENGVQPDPSPISLPQHDAAERALVGAVLARNTAFDEVNSIVTEAHFHDPILRRIWTWIAKMMRDNKPASTHTLEPDMLALTRLDPKHKDYISPEDAKDYLKDLQAASSVISLPRTVEGNARIVRDFAVRREMTRVCAEALDNIATAGTAADSTELVRSLLDRLSAVEATGSTKGGKTLAEAVRGAIRITNEAQEGEVGLPTGILSLDRHIGGLRRSKLYYVAGRPAMGKSILGFQILRNAAHQCYKDGKGVALGISYEMDCEDIAQRYLADLANITIDQQLQVMSPHEHARRLGELEDAEAQLRLLPMIINDQAPTDIAGLISYVKRIHRENEGGVRVLVVDYIGLMGKSGTGKGDAQRESIVSEISRGFKQISRELKIPVIVLSQLNRSVEQREDKRPKLSDLRESGSLEQDADCVMFVYREAYYLQQEEPQDGDEWREWKARMDQIRDESDIIIAKLRQGKTGVVKQHFDGAHFTFKELPNTQHKG